MKNMRSMKEKLGRVIAIAKHKRLPKNKKNPTSDPTDSPEAGIETAFSLMNVSIDNNAFTVDFTDLPTDEPILSSPTITTNLPTDKSIIALPTIANDLRADDTIASLPTVTTEVVARKGFATLPGELQMQIWNEVADSQGGVATVHNTLTRPSGQPVPNNNGPHRARVTYKRSALFSTCKLSRFIAKARYDIIFLGQIARPLRFNYATDALFFQGRSALSLLLHSQILAHPTPPVVGLVQERSSLRKIIIEGDHVTDVETMVAAFTGLEEIIFENQSPLLESRVNLYRSSHGMNVFLRKRVIAAIHHAYNAAPPGQRPAVYRPPVVTFVDRETFQSMV